MDLASEMNASIKKTEDLLNYVGEIFTEFVLGENSGWPTTYATAISMLKSKDYFSDPVRDEICFDQSHPLHWYQLEVGQACPDCEKLPSVSRFYLPIKDKIKRLCGSKSICRKMLAHWDNKEKWLGKNGVTYPLNEIWDGSRFKELELFWNPESRWPIPHQCSHCEKKQNLQNLAIDGTLIFFKCQNCEFEEMIQPKFVQGDPRNIGLIGHWDGWQTCSRGSGMYNILFFWLILTAPAYILL